MKKLTRRDFLKLSGTAAAAGLLALLLPVLLIGCAPATVPAQVEPTSVPVEPTDPPTAPPTAVSTEEPVARWEEVSRMAVTQPVRMAAFLDDTFGITGGGTGAGKTHHTTDGGDTWMIAETSGGCLYGVDVLDEQNVWVCGRMIGQSFNTPGGVRPSTDGGKTFDEQTTFQTTPGRCPLNFVDADTGWVANAGKLNATMDGGATWEEITPDGVIDIAAIALRTPDEGYLLDYDGNLYTTTDGGQSWSSQALDLGEGLEILPSDDFVMAAVRFSDTDNGVVVLNLAGGGGSKVVALRTADGGQTWMEEIVSADIGALYLTHDGELLTIKSLMKSELIVLRYVKD